MHLKGIIVSENKLCLKKLLQLCLILNFTVAKVQIIQTQIQLTTEAATWIANI